MRFTELRKKFQDSSEQSVEEYKTLYLSTELGELINSLNNRFVQYLTVDILGSDVRLDIKKWLGSKFYRVSNDNARDCIEISPATRHLWGRKIINWTDGALKCYDNFLLKYIQFDNKDVIPKRGRFLKETDVYNYLSEKGEKEKKVGENFRFIYQQRSSFHHIQIEVNDEVRVPKYISNSRYNSQRDLILKWFKEALEIMLSIIEEKEKSR